MNKPSSIKTTVTAELDAETAAEVVRIVRARGGTVADFTAEAITRAVAVEADFMAFVQEGIDAADRGDLIPQEDMEAWFEQRVQSYRSRLG